MFSFTVFKYLTNLFAEFAKNISISNNEAHMPPNSPLWNYYAQEAEIHDQEQLSNWNTTMDNHLVFVSIESQL